MHARTGYFELSPDRVDAAVSAFDEEQLPRYREQDGYKGFTLLANRGSGKVLGVSFWESQGKLRASDQLGSEAREAVHSAGGGQSEIVHEEWEVLIDDMA